MNLKDVGITPTQLKRIVEGRKRKPRILPTHITDKTFTFGIVSDTHLGSNEEKLDALHTFYAICKKEGITNILHVGDIVAGNRVYRGQENEVHVFGAKHQADYAVAQYPKVAGITTLFITGNHCLSFWIQNGVDVGELIAEARPDMVYLGQYNGTVQFGHVFVQLTHPDKAGAYAYSYHAQKFVEQIQSGKKPHILLLGHTHTSLYFFYRNIHVFNAGCFEGQTSFLLRKGINPAIGGWTVKLHLGDARTPIVAITPTFIPFFG